MPRVPRNQDLIAALESRRHKAEGLRSAKQLQYALAADTLRAHQKNIYAAKDIVDYVGKKNSGLTKNIFEELNKVLNGDEPIEVAAPTNRQLLAAAQKKEVVEYRPAPRTGAWAILIAIYRESKKIDYPGYMFVQDLKRKAQPLCDTSMTDSAHGFGAWSGNKTLVTHGWITRDNRSKAGGQWGKDRDRVFITESGKAIADFLDRPGAGQAGGQLQVAQPQVTLCDCGIPVQTLDVQGSGRYQVCGSYQRTTVRGHCSFKMKVTGAPLAVGSGRTPPTALALTHALAQVPAIMPTGAVWNANCCRLCQDLAGFLGSTLPYIDMDVSKKDRQHIHKQCEALELMGIRLNHTSEGEGRKRCLRVSRVEAGAPTRAPYSGSHDFLALSPPAKRQRSDAYESFATPGPSMAGSGAPAREMARLAALQRHQQSVASTPVAPFSLPLKDDDEDVGSDEDLRRAIRESQADAGHSSGGDVDELQLALNESMKAASASVTPVVRSRLEELSKEELEFEIARRESLLMSAASTVRPGQDAFPTRDNTPMRMGTVGIAAGGRASVVAQPGGEATVCLVIDQQERVRNADYNTIFQMCYDQHMAHTRAGVRIGVDRASLPLADYMWVVRRGTEALDEETLPEASVLDVLIERKKLSDLVGRSYAKDHVKQIRKMQLAGEHCPRQLLLVEGDPKTAQYLTAFGAGATPLPGSIIQTDEDVYALTYDIIMLGQGNRLKVVTVMDTMCTARLLTQISLLLTALLVHPQRRAEDRATFAQFRRECLDQRAVARSHKMPNISGLDRDVSEQKVEEAFVDAVVERDDVRFHGYRTFDDTLFVVRMRGRDFLTAILDNLRQIRGSGVAPAPSMSFADAGEAVVSLLSAVEAASAQRAPDMRKVLLVENIGAAAIYFKREMAKDPSKYALACEGLVDAVAMLEAVVLLRTEWALQLAPSVAAADSFLRVCAARTLDRARAGSGAGVVRHSTTLAVAEAHGTLATPGGREWECPICTYANSAGAPACGVCEKRRPEASDVLGFGGEKAKSTLVEDTTPPRHWACAVCTFLNQAGASCCEMCDGPRP